MSINFTVAIPTYNGATRLPKILDKLLKQSNIEHLNWEIIIVDNNSKDTTAKIVNDYINNWHYPYTLKYYFEAEQGAAFARQRAVREARGELIFFIDDDNLPDTNWLAAAYTFGEEHPKAGAYSGQIHGNFEGEPPENFDKIKQFLAIREHGEQPHLFDADSLRLPPAAALVVRKQAWLERVPSRPFLTGKLPGVMVQGDDYEPLLYIHKAGWEIWYNPAMHTYHQIPQWRLERGYLLTLARGCGLATCSLRMVAVKNSHKPIIIFRTILGNLRRVAFHFIKYRQQLKTDLIAAFEMEFFLGSLLSPFLFLKTSLNRRK